MRPVLIGFFTVILLLLLPSHDGAAHASAFLSHKIAQPQSASQKRRAKRRRKSKTKSEIPDIVSAKASDIPPRRQGVPTIVGGPLGSGSDSNHDPLGLVVTVSENGKVFLNRVEEGTLSDLSALRARLELIFEQRKENNVFKTGTDELEKTVIVKSSTYMNEEQLSKVVGEVKAAGASPVRVMTEEEFEEAFSSPPENIVSRPQPMISNRQPVMGGVLNGKAISLPKPAYPAIAKSAKASGTVVVAVLIDESGNVISAQAVSGPPLLRASAVQAARQARFSPTLLSGQPVRVKGVLNYNFVP
jgi:TonB family protein